jgi:hypothetical protein
MGRVILVFLLAISSTITFAEEPLPSGITPLTGSVTLRYAPKFESRCTVKKSEKKPGEFFGTKTFQALTMEVFNESERTKLAVRVPVGANYLRMIIALTDDRTMTGATNIEIQSDIEDFKKNSEQFRNLLLGFMKKLSGAEIFGKPLQQGSKVFTESFGELVSTFYALEDSVENLSGGSKSAKMPMIKVNSDNYSVVGIASINRRESLVFSGEILFEVGAGDARVSAKITGWDAYDLQSGLKAGASFLTVATVAEKGAVTSTEDTECFISGAPSTTTRARSEEAQGAKTTEQRLIELKSLLNKGLITQEQFESKRTEIVNSL